MLSKDGCQGKPEQYRPITSLDTLYKNLTETLAMEFLLVGGVTGNMSWLLQVLATLA